MISFHFISLFPEVITTYCSHSIIGRAQSKKLVRITVTNPRAFVTDRHKIVDDRPYGGGPGMVLKAEPIYKAVTAALKRKQKSKIKILILSPQGKLFNNHFAQDLAKKYSDIVLIAGHYEGIDSRTKKILQKEIFSSNKKAGKKIDVEEISVGPYVVTGGEVPALLVADATIRQIPGVLGKEESLEENRIQAKEMYTRPEVINIHGKKYRVPAVLLSGNHKHIEEWRKKLL